MRARLAELLVCPVTGGPLELHVFEERRLSLDGRQKDRARRLGVSVEGLEHEVTSGILLSRAGKIAFPILRGVPRLLRFPTAAAAEFAEIWGGRLRESFPGVSLPGGCPEAGESEILRSFSAEWLGYGWSQDMYWSQPTPDWLRSMRFALDASPGALDGRRVLEVGTGIGGVSADLCKGSECEVVGVDLSYAIEVAQREFSADPFVHFAQCSVFGLPFRAGAFEFAFSFGVLHHTFDTKRAFDELSARVAPGGRLSIWVYSPENEERNPIRKFLMGVERAVRPPLSRLPRSLQTALLLPTLPAYWLHQRIQVRRGEPVSAYGLREALHAARDRLTPRFAHRHSESEVREWFEEAGFERVVCGSQRERPTWLPIGFLGNTLVAGEKHS